MGIFEMSYESRALDTDTLDAPPGHVITGLRFRKIGEHINLEARITPISFKDGKLDSATSTWIGNDKTQGSYENRRTRVSLISPNVPTKYLGKNSIDSKNNQFVLFGATSSQKDAAQTTVPFIDAQEGSIGYGGFVGFLVNTLDFSSHLLPDYQNDNGEQRRSDSENEKLILREVMKYDFSANQNL